MGTQLPFNEPIYLSFIYQIFSCFFVGTSVTNGILLNNLSGEFYNLFQTFFFLSGLIFAFVLFSKGALAFLIMIILFDFRVCPFRRGPSLTFLIMIIDTLPQYFFPFFSF